MMQGGSACFGHEIPWTEVVDKCRVLLKADMYQELDGLDRRVN